MGPLEYCRERNLKAQGEGNLSMDLLFTSCSVSLKHTSWEDQNLSLYQRFRKCICEGSTTITGVISLDYLVLIGGNQISLPSNWAISLFFKDLYAIPILSFFICFHFHHKVNERRIMVLAQVISSLALFITVHDPHLMVYKYKWIDKSKDGWMIH